MCAESVFTAGLDVVQNVAVGVQVSVEDKPHGELCKNKTQLRRKRERVGTHDHVFLQLLDTTQRTNDGWIKTGSRLTLKMQLKTDWKMTM